MTEIYNIRKRLTKQSADDCVMWKIKLIVLMSITVNITIQY